jgi:hypothetical protein
VIKMTEKTKEKLLMCPDHPQWIEFCKEVLQSKTCHPDGRELKKLLRKYNASGEWINEHGAFCLCEIDANILFNLRISDQLPPELSEIYDKDELEE